jgi:predicted XRE-type DNA-binding protein
VLTLIRDRIRRLKENAEMNDDFDVIHGSGNVFRDFDRSAADADQLKAVLAAQIIKVLDRRKLTVRQAGEATGVAAADFSRIRNANLARFTIDRLMSILARLDQKIDIAVSVHPKKRRSQAASPR